LAVCFTHRGNPITRRPINRLFPQAQERRQESKGFYRMFFFFDEAGLFAREISFGRRF